MTYNRIVHIHQLDMRNNLAKSATNLLVFCVFLENSRSLFHHKWARAAIDFMQFSLFSIYKKKKQILKTTSKKKTNSKNFKFLAMAIKIALVSVVAFIVAIVTIVADLPKNLEETPIWLVFARFVVSKPNGKKKQSHRTLF